MLDFSSIESMFTDGERPYLTINDLARRGKYSEAFLLTEVRKGKLKAFKVGDSWLTSEAWYQDWQETIRRLVEEELETTNDSDQFEPKWLRPMARPESSGQFNYYVWTAVFWTLLLFFSAGQLFFWSATGLISTDGRVINFGQRVSVGSDLVPRLVLSASGKVYAESLKLATRVVRSDYPLNDERLTDWLTGLWQSSGQVAGDSDQQIKPLR